MSDEEKPQVDGSLHPSGPLTIVTRGIAVSPDTISTVLHEMPRADLGVVLGWGGVTVTIWLTFATATFHDFAGLSANTLRNSFFFAGLVATGATLHSLRAYRERSASNSVKAIVDEICRRSSS